MQSTVGMSLKTMWLKWHMGIRICYEDTGNRPSVPMHMHVVTKKKNIYNTEEFEVSNHGPSGPNHQNERQLSRVHGSNQGPLGLYKCSFIHLQYITEWDSNPRPLNSIQMFVYSVDHSSSPQLTVKNK